MSEKERTTIWIDPVVLQKIKFLGVKHRLPIGDVVDALVAFSETGQYVKDQSFVRRFENLKEMAFANAGEHEGKLLG